MASTAASIIARLGLDARDFRAGLNNARREVSAFGGHLLNLPSLGVILGGASVAAGVRSLVEYGTTIQDLSDRFGVSTDSIQRFGNAAEKNGSSLETVASAFGKLAVARQKALSGDESMVAAFNNLGVSIAELKKLGPDQLMEKLGASSLNASDTVKILGRNSLELRPTLRGLADGTIAFSVAINSIDVKHLKDTSNAWKELSDNVRAYAVAAGDKIAEVALHQNQPLKQMSAEVGGFFGRLAVVGVTAWETVSKAATGHFAESKKSLGEWARSWKSLLGAGGIPATEMEKIIGPPKGAASVPVKKQLDQGDAEEEAKIERKRREILDEAREETKIRQTQLDMNDELAKALETHLDFRKKIFQAEEDNNQALANELRLQEKLAISKQAQAIVQKNVERGQLSLQDLAKNGILIGGPGGQARQALQQEALARQAALHGDLKGALSFQNRADDIKRGIGVLKQSEKNLNAADVQGAIDASKVLQGLLNKIGANR